MSEDNNTKSIDNNKIPNIPRVPGIVPNIPMVPILGSNIPIVPGNIPLVPGNISGIPGGNIPAIPGKNIPAIPGGNIPAIPGGIPAIPGKNIPAIPGGNLPSKGPNIPTIPGGLPSVPGMNKIPMGPPSIPGMININMNQPVLKPKTKVRTVQTMKPLYWIVIEPRKIPNTIWEKLDDSQISINAIKFEDEFGQKKKEVTTVVKTETAKVVTSKPSMLLPARQQNINIVVSKLRMTPISIVEALISYDEKVLTPQVCDLLIPILPNEAEINQVDAFDGDPMTLADCDQFVLLMTTAPGYDLRFKSLIFKNCYKEEVIDILKKVEYFFNAFQFVLTNSNFHKWLEIILAYGNYLNGVSNRGGAYGYKLDTLSKLIEFKSNDNKKNLLYYIVEYIGDVLKNDELLNLTNQLNIFSQLSMQSINDSFKDLNIKYKNVCSLSELINKIENLEEDDKSLQFLDSFLNNAKISMLTVEEKVKSIEEKYKELITKFGDTPKDMPMDTFIEIFNKFNKDLNAVKVNYLRARELKEKMEKKKTIKV